MVPGGTGHGPWRGSRDTARSRSRPGRRPGRRRRSPSAARRPGRSPRSSRPARARERPDPAGGTRPAKVSTSVPQTPEASTRSSASSSPDRRSGEGPSSSNVPGAVCTTARTSSATDADATARRYVARDDADPCRSSTWPSSATARSVADGLARLRRGRPPGRGARLPAGLVRRAPQHGSDRVVGHRGAHRPRRRAHRADPPRRGRDHAAQPLAADDRRAVRDARGAAPGTHRPRPRAGRPGPTRSPSGRCAATRVRPRPSPRTWSSSRATSPARAGCPASRPPRARARASRSTSSARRSSGPSWPGSSASPSGSPRTSRPAALIEAVTLYRRTFRPSAQLDAPYVIAGVNVIAADTDDDARAPAGRHPSRPGEAHVQPGWRTAHRRRGRGRAALARRRRSSTTCSATRRSAPRTRSLRRSTRVRGVRRRRRADDGPQRHLARVSGSARSSSPPPRSAWADPATRLHQTRSSGGGFIVDGGRQPHCFSWA